MRCKAHGAQNPRHINEIGEEASAAQRSKSLAQALNQRFLKYVITCLIILKMEQGAVCFDSPDYPGEIMCAIMCISGNVQDRGGMNPKQEDKKIHAAHRAYVWRLVLSILFVNALAYGAVYWVLTSSRYQYETRARVASQNVVSLLEQNTTNIIEKIDVILHVVADELGRRMATGNVDANRLDWYLRGTLHTIPELDRFCVTGASAKGTHRCDAVKEGSIQAGLDVKQLDLSKPMPSGLVITSPFFSEASQKWKIQILRRYNMPDGTYAGAVGVVMDLKRFSTHFASVNVGEKGRIALLSGAQGVIAQYPEAGGEVRSAGMPASQRMMQKPPYQEGTYLAHDQEDGKTQMVSYQKIGSWPLFIQVSLSEDEYLADWQGEAKVGVLLAAFFTLLSLLIVYLMHRHWLARRVVLDMLTQKESLYRSFAEMSNDWFWEQDENLIFTKMSGSLLDTYRVGPEQFIGKTRWDVAVDVPEEKMAIHKAQVMARRPFKDFEYSFYNQAGEMRTISVSGMPVFNADGDFKGYRGTGKDVTERRLYDESIQRMAQYDHLTGLPNRVLFNDRLDMAMSFVRREGHKFALLYFDLDKFKPVNDNYGHDAGDNLLQQVARRVSLELREADTVARLGGDEFAILQMGVDHREDAGEVANRVIAALTAPFAVAGVEDEVRIGVSIGIALYPDDADSKRRLLKVADTAMYEAKKVRNCYRMYTSNEHLGAHNNGEQA